ncbi:MAG: LptE family protein [Bacteroidota bacterium]
MILIRRKKPWIIIITAVIAFFIHGCTIKYSFTGASLSPEVKTISVQFFPNRAQLVNPSLSQNFTESLRDKFLSQTSLEQIDGTGDLNFEGEITDYNTKPMSIQGNETAALNRLTITVKVRFSNAIEPGDDFETNFSAFEDYDSSKSLDEVEDELAQQIIDKLVEDIFNRSVAKW